MKNRKGFTLAEMMIVIAIVVILSGATVIGVVSWLNNAKTTAANLEANNGDNFEKEEMESIKKIGGTAGSLQQPTETLQGGSGGSGGTTKATQATQATQGNQSEPSGETTLKPLDENEKKHNSDIENWINELIKQGCPEDKITVTKDKRGVVTGVKVDWEDPNAKENTWGKQLEKERSKPQKVGDVSIPGGFVSSGVGLTDVSQNGDSYTFDVTNWGNDASFTIKPKGNGKYDFKITPDKRWMLDGMPGYNYNDYGSTVEIGSQQLTWLQNKFGFTFN